MNVRKLLAVLMMLSALPATLKAQVTVLQLNDIYRIDAVDNGTRGGPGRVATLIDRVKKNGPVLVLHGGDFIAPSLESTYFGGRQMIDAMNYLATKAPFIVVPGNHEYDSSNPAMLGDAVAASRFPWLAANLTLSTGNTASDQRIQKDTIITMGGLRIGIFGLTLIDTPRQYALVDQNYLQLAERELSSLEQRGADVIIALTHLPIEIDRQMAALRQSHPKFAWIVSGHEHDDFLIPGNETTALISNGASNARTMYQATITKAGAVTARSVPLDSMVAIDATYERQILQRYRAEIEKIVPFFNQVIGRTSVALAGTEADVRESESNWGNYIADVMRTAYPALPADIAVVNGGSLRLDDTILPGDLKWEHLARTFGFPFRVALVWLKGSDVKSSILENSVSQPAGDGRFLQVSGVKFSYDRRKPMGSRVSDISVQKNGAWQPLDPNAVYVVAVGDYAYGGGDGYTFHAKSIMSIPPGPDLKLMVFDALMSLYARGQAIAPSVEGRIVELK